MLKFLNRNVSRLRQNISRRGTATVEFALVAPVFFLFLMGTIEFGRVMMVQNVLINAAREGCRTAIISGSTAAAVKTKATSYANAAGVRNTTATVEPANLATATTSTPIKVTVSVKFDDVSWLPAPWFLKGKTISGTTSMRLESMD